MSATTTALQEAVIQQYSKQLRLPTVGGQFARLAAQAVKEKQGHLSYLEALLQAEVEERDCRTIARRIQEARFPAVKSLEQFDFECASHIPAAQVRELAEGGYLARNEPIIFLGETGIGKTHLATGLAVAACRQRKRVRFTTAAELVTELIEARNQQELQRMRSRWLPNHGRQAAVIRACQLAERNTTEMNQQRRKPGCGNCRAMETVEKQTAFFHRSHSAWKTRPRTPSFPQFPQPLRLANMEVTTRKT